ncbi:DUF1127 domain-containing protein [Ciceribacter sp. L1K23]|uniref:DUF1127 domain-containing protein n=1 Tax=Ciceribacter sp. L1K23 TaxID=2820276 RepID=UPI001B811576|nr:DUF1127 domain-containing protein [Ciceribacter sp. L1K23]MBR0555316.1 DUF1127 domain-containing protein [Ciceribacter sp. L1K23]
MRRYDEYLITIDTIYPDSYVRESQFLASGDLLAPAPMPAPRSGILGLVDRWRNWNARRAGRLSLRDMSDEQLRDIGVSRLEAMSEAGRSRLLTWF